MSDSGANALASCFDWLQLTHNCNMQSDVLAKTGYVHSIVVVVPQKTCL